MAKTINFDKDKNEFIKPLRKAVQSTNLNFLIGSGCSCPALQALGDIENEVQEKIKNNEHDKANKLLFDYLKPFLDSSKSLIDDTPDEVHRTTLDNYNNFIRAISKVLFERKSNILNKQATVFTTNYDLFIEKSAEQFAGSLILNDGFKRFPSLSGSFPFSPTEYFNTVFNSGNLYNYQVQVPSVNLIKLHGSIINRGTQYLLLWFALRFSSPLNARLVIVSGRLKQ